MKNAVIARFQAKTPPKPPKTLGKDGRALWTSIQLEYEVGDPGGLAHLASACRAEDDIARMRATVAADGDMLTDRFGQKVSHPLHAAIRGAEQVRRQSLRALNLDLEPLKSPGRPTGGGGGR